MQLVVLDDGYLCLLQKQVMVIGDCQDIFLVGGGGKHACVIDVCWSFFVSSFLLFTIIANVLSDLILFPQAWCYVTQVHVSILQDGQ